MFIGREKELQELNNLYQQNRFQMFVLYGRRRVGKTTLLKEFCKGKKTIFYSAEQSNDKLNLEKFSGQIFKVYNETLLQPFTSWENAFLYINEKQKDEQIIIILDEFPYLADLNTSLMSKLQHLIDHQLQDSKIFLVLCGSYMGFMEKEVLGAKSPLFGRRTGQLHVKPFHYMTTAKFLNKFTREEQFILYGVFGGTPMYLSQIVQQKSVKENIIDCFLTPSGYLYEETLLLLRQEVNEPGMYSAIIEAIASGASKSNEISTKTGEPAAKCLKYINTLCELGILYKEVPFGDKETSRKTIYCISDFMFRFWYRFVSSNKTLLETDAQEIVWKKKIEPDLNHYMGVVFEQICKEYLLQKNSKGELPIFFTKIGRWWGTNNKTHTQEEIDLIAQDGNDYLFCECKWRNELLDSSVLYKLEERSDVYSQNRNQTWYLLFSKSGFTTELEVLAAKRKDIILIESDEM